MVLGVDILNARERELIASTPIFEALIVTDEYTGTEKTLPSYTPKIDINVWNRKFYWRCIRVGSQNPDIRLIKEELW